MWPGKPFWSNDRAAIYHGNCAEVIQLWPRRSLDLLVTDPPYGIDYASGFAQHAKIIGDANPETIKQLIHCILRPLRDGRHAYVFGFKPQDLLGIFSQTTELIWSKGSVGMGDLTQPWGSAHEPITFGVYYPDKTNRTKKRGGLTARLRKGSVLHVPRLNSHQTARHPTEKPVKMLRQLIESSSVIDDIVFDPFAGVCSTGVAALLLDRRTICIELDKDYCRIGAERLMLASTLAASCREV